MNKKIAGNTGFASGGVTCNPESFRDGALWFYSSVVPVDRFVLRNPPERKARKKLHPISMTTKKTIIILLTLPLMFMLTGCSPMSDCTHNFVYNGTINANDSLLKDSLVIRFDNLGDIIFNIQDRLLADTSIIDSEGYFKVKGDFFTVCDSDKDMFDEKDSLSFEVARRGHVIRKGKFCIMKLNRQYTDSAYFTTFTLPTIQIE